MNGLKVVVLTACALGVCAARSESATNREIARSWTQPVCLVESFARDSQVGAGFLSSTYSPDVIILFTAKHMLENRDSVRVTWRAVDPGGRIIPVSFSLDLMRGGMRMYLVSDTAQDCAWIPFPTETLRSRVCLGCTFSTFDTLGYVSTADLLPGMDVIVCGFPLGFRLSQSSPMVRKGAIVGVEPSSNTILLDAATIGGFSGGPVLVDKTSNLGREINGSLVGLCFGYNLRRSQRQALSGSDTVSFEEELRLSRVVPAEVLLRSVELFKKKE